MSERKSIAIAKKKIKENQNKNYLSVWYNCLSVCLFVSPDCSNYSDNLAEFINRSFL